ncbi:MAG: hypothetical protein HQK75_05335 [Candidatus Magnetomorum sp.]|nr:hypothetical protein [Candidatus Magnetomorum sp.]
MQYYPKNTFLVILTMIYIGCGGGGSSSSPTTQVPDDPLEKQWQSVQLNTIESSGLHRANVKSMIDSNDQFHIVYFSSAGANDYSIYHQMWDSRTFQPVNSKTSVIKIDNCRDIGMGLTMDSLPIVVYQGGSFPLCGEKEQSDVMMNVFTDNQWKESTIEIGRVERNPVINNGVAGGFLDMVVDPLNQVHVCFQFFYEGCDTMNVNYPDLWYVTFSADTPDQIPEHETVEGNSFDGAGIQNKVGDYCTIALDSTHQPMIFYYYEAPLPENEKGLRVAMKNGLDWQPEWIKKDCEIGYISAAWNDKRSIMGVAYYVIKDFSYGGSDHFLEYAERINGQWKILWTDDSTLCGNYCSLTFDNDDHPLIAYRSDESRSGYQLNALKLCRGKNDQIFETETVSNTNNMGTHNTIFVDDSNTIYITSYSIEKKCVYMLNQ